VSRARRKPRHRRSPRLLTQVAPVALGGAVAAVALTASPLDVLRRPPGAGSAEARPDGPADRGDQQLVQVEPAGDSRGDGGRPTPGGAPQHRSAPARGAPARSPPSTPPAADRAVGATRARRTAPSVGSSVATDSPAPPPAPAPDPTGTQPAGPSLPVPLPTPSTTSLPSFPVPLPTVSLPVSLPVTLR
jgi:hypothetical protein